MVGTGRFELPTPRTPSECSTRLSHVPTQSSRLGGSRLLGSFLVYTREALRARARSENQCVGGTNSWGRPSPSLKKNCSICSTRNCCACGVQGCKRYSFSSIFCRSTHSPQAACETFLKIFWPNSESKGGSSRPSISFL